MAIKNMQNIWAEHGISGIFFNVGRIQNKIFLEASNFCSVSCKRALLIGLTKKFIWFFP